MEKVFFFAFTPDAETYYTFKHIVEKQGKRVEEVLYQFMRTVNNFAYPEQYVDHLLVEAALNMIEMDPITLAVKDKKEAVAEEDHTAASAEEQNADTSGTLEAKPFSAEDIKNFVTKMDQQLDKEVASWVSNRFEH